MSLTAITLCGLFAGCSSQEPAGWSSRVTVGSDSAWLTAGDPLGQALYASHQRREARDERFAQAFGREPWPERAGDATATASAPSDD